MIKSRPGYVYGTCPDCNGEGILPPAGNTSESNFDIKNIFPRCCDNCNGAGKRYIKIEENNTP